MGFTDFFRENQSSKRIELKDLIFESANRFIEINNRKIVKKLDNGNKYIVLTKNSLSELLEHLSRDTTKKANDFIEQNYASLSNDPMKNSELKKVLDSVQNNIDAINKTVRGGLIHKEGEKNIYSVSRVMLKQDEEINAINLVLANIQQLVEKQENTIREQTKVIENQHNSILRYENDVLFKSKKELLMELIGIADQISYTLADQQESPDYNSLLEAVKSLGEWVNGSLQTETVRKFEYTKRDNRTLDTKTQEVIDVEGTHNLDEDGRYKTILPGYFWTMLLVGSSAMQNNQSGPRSFEFVLRPEQVVRLKFKPEHIETKLTDEEAVLLDKEDPQEKKVDMVDSNKITNVAELLTIKNDYGKEKNDQVLLREGECDSSKDSLEDKISNGQAMQLCHSNGLHFEDKISSLKDNKRFKGKSRK